MHNTSATAWEWVTAPPKVKMVGLPVGVFRSEESGFSRVMLQEGVSAHLRQESTRAQRLLRFL